jgi:hypothetical protein
LNGLLTRSLGSFTKARICREAAYLNKVLHLTAIPLRSIAAGELER